MSSKSEDNVWIKTSNLCSVLVKNCTSGDMFYRIAHKIECDEGIVYLDALTNTEFNNESLEYEVLDEEKLNFETDYLELSRLIICQNNVSNLNNPMIKTNLKRKRIKY